MANPGSTGSAGNESEQHDDGRIEITVTAAHAGQRLDQVLAAAAPELSRRRARVLIDIGGVFLDGVRTKMAGRVVKEGQTITAQLGGAFERATKKLGRAAREADAASLPVYTVVHEDEHVVVVDKPAGLLTAPTPESDRGNLADLLARRGERRAPIFVVHRIDLPTSGLLVFAKTEDANRALSERFRVHDIVREYLTVVSGRFPDDLRTIERPIEGRRAVTHVEPIEDLGGIATVLRCRLETGRTHQIRIHMRAVRHPVLGDPSVGIPRELPRPPRMALHAAKLGFVHPGTGESVLYEAPLPSDLAGWLSDVRAKLAVPEAPR